MKNWKRILQLLEELETHKDFYQRSLDRLSRNLTQENYDIYIADAMVMHNAERELYQLSRGN